MKKSIYSLVLMDDVIRAVDEEACRLGTSRSNLINQILAEHFSCLTPEMRMRDIFNQVTALINGSFQLQQRTASALTFRTALQYKYHPTINYRVELKREPDRFLGKLNVSIRTQNSQLLDQCTSFFKYRCEMEMKCLAERGYDDYTAALGRGAFSRGLYHTEGMFEETAAEAICDYISDFDRSLMLFLADRDAFVLHMPELEESYRNMLDKYVV